MAIVQFVAAEIVGLIQIDPVGSKFFPQFLFLTLEALELGFGCFRTGQLDQKIPELRSDRGGLFGCLDPRFPIQIIVDAGGNVFHLKHILTILQEDEISHEERHVEMVFRYPSASTIDGKRWKWL